jgi:4-hydroxybenzoate polyprenyltransferase
VFNGKKRSKSAMKCAYGASKIGIVLVLHFNPWVEASAGGLLVPEGLYSPVAKHFGVWFKMRI